MVRTVKKEHLRRSDGNHRAVSALRRWREAIVARRHAQRETRSPMWLRFKVSLPVWGPVLAALLAGCAPNQREDAMSARSPDGRTRILAMQFPDGSLAIRVRRNGAELVAPSRVGLRLAENQFGPMRFVSLQQRAVAADRTQDDPGYGELLAWAQEDSGPKRRLLLRLRAYDQGAAFRMELAPMQGGGAVRLAEETTQLQFPSDYACLAVRHTEYLNSHEGDYAPVRVSGLRAGALYDLPLSCQTGRAGETIALSESDVEHYPGAYLVKGEKLNVAVRLTPMPAKDHLAAVTESARGLRTPWRVIMIADRPEQLIENTLVRTLASPSRVGDTRWIKPGKAAWAWWSGLKQSGVPNAGYNDATYRHYIDFAGRFGLPYFVIDWGWAARPRGDKELADVTQFRPGVDIPALSRYAAQRGVRLWLWTNWKALDDRMDEVFALYERWGIAGLKVDYVYRQDQDAIAYYHRLLATAARHHLLVNIHGAPVPRGLERTYPNLLTVEGVMAAEYNKWSRSVTAGHNVRLAYSRTAIGPMDYTPGGFRNVSPEDFVARKAMPMVMTTRAQQLAMFVVYPSPLQSLADAPSAYIDAEGRLAPGAGFLRAVPAVWDETRGVAGEWARWIAVARRSGRRWYIGVIGDEQPRTVALPLTFLHKGRWRMRALIDSKAPADLLGRTGIVEAKTVLRVSLAGSGGAALVLDPE